MLCVANIGHHVGLNIRTCTVFRAASVWLNTSIVGQLLQPSQGNCRVVFSKTQQNIHLKHKILFLYETMYQNIKLNGREQIDKTILVSFENNWF